MGRQRSIGTAKSEGSRSDLTDGFQFARSFPSRLFLVCGSPAGNRPNERRTTRRKRDSIEALGKKSERGTPSGLEAD